MKISRVIAMVWNKLLSVNYAMKKNVDVLANLNSNYQHLKISQTSAFKFSHIFQNKFDLELCVG